MAWELNNDRPIYSQIVEKIQIQIVSGYYPSGSKLPSVRELAAEAGVNPNTMQKAFMELERSGLITTMRTSGRIVTEDESMIREVKETIAKMEIEQFFKKMREIGFSQEETLDLAKNVYKEEK
ncbi:MAG: GntR family transcriptional regulator [Lachnospiraceae bacterium]|nr:GntR family transcriptional regulator [Lachnospiraceae bacterium]